MPTPRMAPTPVEPAASARSTLLDRLVLALSLTSYVARTSPTSDRMRFCRAAFFCLRLHRGKQGHQGVFNVKYCSKTRGHYGRSSLQHHIAHHLKQGPRRTFERNVARVLMDTRHTLLHLKYSALSSVAAIAAVQASVVRFEIASDTPPGRPARATVHAHKPPSYQSARPESAQNKALCPFLLERSLKKKRTNERTNTHSFPK